MIASRHFTHDHLPARNAVAPRPARTLSASDEAQLQAAADELEQLAEEIRNRGMRGHQRGELLPQWNRLRELERQLRPMVEAAPETAQQPALVAATT